MHGNQRIESWSSQYRRYRSTNTINFFKDLVDNDIYNPEDPLYLHATRYCFGPIIQKDLDSVAERWHSHRVRPSRRDTIPGVLDELYSFSDFIGAKNMFLPNDRKYIEEIYVKIFSLVCSVFKIQ